MPFEVNFNPQFEQFVKFADNAMKAGNGKMVAKMGAEDPIAGCTITRQTNDKVGALFRQNTTKKQNDAVRELFKKSIIDMFGGASKIPQSVKDAMLLSDYDKGKPLTARRIEAVKLEVIKAARDLEGCLGRAISNAADTVLFQDVTAEQREQTKDLIAVAIKNCYEDKEVYQLVSTHLTRILVGGDGKLRSPEAVQRKVEELIANFNELRALSKKNPAVMKAGIRFMESLGGKSVPPGLMGRIVGQMSKVKVGDVKKLSKTSTGLGIHKAVTQFKEEVQKVMDVTDAENLLEGGDELEPCRNFVINLIVAKCGDSAVAKMMEAFSTEKMAKLRTLYGRVSEGNFNAKDITPSLVRVTKDQAVIHIKSLDALKYALACHCGKAPKKPEPVEPFEGSFNYNEVSAFTVVHGIIDSAVKVSHKDREVFLQKTVQGDSPGATALRKIYADLIGTEPYKPSEQFDYAMERVTQSMLNGTMCISCKHFAMGAPEKTIFAKDIIRDQVIYLPGKQRVSNDFAKACDELAKFISGNPDATYAGLDAVTKTKVHIAMSFLNQEGAKAGLEAHAVALDPKRKEPAYFTASQQNLDIRDFSLELDSSGGLIIHFEGRQFVQRIGTSTALEDTGPGSTVEVSYTLHLHAKELDRLAHLDFAQCDLTAYQAIQGDSQAEQKYEKSAKALPTEFQFSKYAQDCTCRVQYSATLTPPQRN